MTDYPCGFRAVNSDHCWLNNKCRVCGVTRSPEKVEIIPIELPDPNTPTRAV